MAANQFRSCGLGSRARQRCVDSFSTARISVPFDMDFYLAVDIKQGGQMVQYSAVLRWNCRAIQRKIIQSL